jgi:hypothetical protein
VAELCHRYGGAMKQRRAGRILNVASTAAFQPTPYFAAYSTPSRTPFHSDGGQHSAVMADTVPR